jgi:glutamine synthetase
MATFMARCTALGTESSTGAHVHQSLVRDGENAFATTDGGAVSETALHYLGGLLHTLTDFNVVFRPTVNSYRRGNRGEWSPVDRSWGYENRTSAVRAMTRPAPGGARLEHRVSGADVNPWLVVLALLGGGLHGMQEKLDPGEPDTSGADQNGRFERLPATLPESIDAFERSALAREILGPGLVEHYVASRRAEEAAYQAWLAETVTEFEFRRYFEAH